MRSQGKLEGDGFAVRISAIVDRPNPDGAIRARLLYTPGPNSFRLAARRAQGARLYQAGFRPDGSSAFAQYADHGSSAIREIPGQKFPLKQPLSTGQPVVMELRVVGETITVKINQQLVFEGRDDRLAAGGWGIQRSDVKIQALEYLDLGGQAALGTAPATATKDAPPVNDRGMKSVSAPMTGGPANAASDPSKWQPLVPEDLWRREVPGKREYRDGMLHLKTGLEKPVRIEDGAVRARVHFKDGEAKSVAVVARSKDGHQYKFQAAQASPGRETVFRLSSFDGKARKESELARAREPRSFKTGDRFDLELHVVGEELTGLVDGVPVLSARDGRIKGPGQWGINAVDGWYVSAEVREISAQEPTAGGASPKGKVPESDAWRDALADPGKVNLDAGARIANGTLLLTDKSRLILNELTGPDGAVRIRQRFGGNGPTLSIRLTDSERYGVHVTRSGEVRLFRTASDGDTVDLVRAPAQSSLREGEEYELELRARGSLLTVRINGELLAEQHDAAIPTGRAGVFNYTGTDQEVTAVHFLSLGPDRRDAGKGEGSGSPAAATKDAPFVNSLGMKFVPVPITGGPTDGKRVLFSVWETRGQDYEVFVEESGHAWPTRERTLGPDHPVSAVSWESADAFCRWLTDRERKAGRLDAAHVYRLPTDHEWSCALGVGAEEDPQEEPGPKSKRLPGRFLWGTEWPPPITAGNFASEPGRAAASASGRTITERDDGFSRTAPVGSFAEGPHGLFDLGGNVAEYCSDLVAKNSSRRVLRGGSWNNAGDRVLRAAHRFAEEPAAMNTANGFRVVLAPAE